VLMLTQRGGWPAEPWRGWVVLTRSTPCHAHAVRRGERPKNLLHVRSRLSGAGRADDADDADLIRSGLVSSRSLGYPSPLTPHPLPVGSGASSPLFPSSLVLRHTP